MARKTLLTENELRQFMKLACLHPIGQSRLDEFGYNPLDEEEEDPEKPKGKNMSQDKIRVGVIGVGRA